ncbi:SDR family oxidoreductase [Vibrio sp. TH_r3]|uniref:UDP-glucose 4-epimerase family protein n=1 Tax=Vibrio sp. TH_r3 TaxID=3082084 RepID=UPI002953F21D|nr:SDR family oxidoreductase [Vibrio sp. TH_r3]MDV7104218.1 SDR family oxidoreductase [Vibrio sp. TH_r3]
MKLLVTGSSGFVGSRLVQLAFEREWDCIEVKRRVSFDKEITNKAYFEVAELTEHTDWSGAFVEIDCIVHCAARVHQMNELEADTKLAYHQVNTLATLHLARQAAQAGVKRFVFISSIKVNGESTQVGQPFKPTVHVAPTDPYGLSKYNAEIGLQEIAHETGLEVVIIRPPLVYGPGVKANFNSMMKLVYKGWPLPLGAINNQRSLIFLDNLVDVILTACEHNNAPGCTFLVSDDNDVSVTELLRAIASSMEKKNVLLPIPTKWIMFATKMIGKAAIGQRLCDSLQVDVSQTKHKLDWTPPVDFTQGIQKTVDDFLLK